MRKQEKFRYGIGTLFQHGQLFTHADIFPVAYLSAPALSLPDQGIRRLDYSATDNRRQIEAMRSELVAAIKDYRAKTEALEKGKGKEKGKEKENDA